MVLPDLEAGLSEQPARLYQVGPVEEGQSLAVAAGVVRAGVPALQVQALGAID